MELIKAPLISLRCIRKFKLESENRKFKLESENLRFNLESKNLRFNLESENGSTLPLLIGLVFFALSTYIVAVNIYFLGASKIKLEQWGEEFISSLFQEISYQEYFFDADEPIRDDVRSFVYVGCTDLLLQIQRKLNEVDPNRRFISARCAAGRISIVIEERVKLPFAPQGLSNFEPRVTAYVEAGLQRVRKDR